MRGSAGIIVNSFDALEANVLRAIVDGRCTPGSPPPPIYSVGPIVKETSSAVSKHMCLTWLDSQPKGSVVFLCFGRDGVFFEAQLAEMAKGLEKSGARFLWVVRDPERTRHTMDLDSILPSGFLDRTKDRGLVVERWAPQSEVLSHGSVGGFVTHCGWNSILESLCVGVPMIGWPLYAEQKMTKHSLVHEIGVVLELKMDEPRDGVTVSADELANRVVELMTDSERGKAVRDRVTAMKEAAAAAMSVNGSSHVAVTKLVESFKQG
ncbi:Anthocyanidin 5,3-O-glucosyltransferase [Linum grandiflorum]